MAKTTKTSPQSSHTGTRRAGKESKRRVSVRPKAKRRGRKNAGDAAGRVHKNVVFGVRVASCVSDGTGRDVRQVELVAPSRSRSQRGSALPVASAERAQAARQVTRRSKADRLAGLLAALAHPQRLVILRVLLEGEATHKLLRKHTGLKAGPLYYHLRALRETGLIGPKVRDLYAITRRGAHALLAAVAIERLCQQP